jgi:hypothetical protein
MKIVYFNSFEYIDGYTNIITTTRFNFIEAALYITQNDVIEHLIQRDQIRRGFALYYHDVFIDFTLFDDNTTLKDVMLHYSINLPSFLEIIDVLHDLTLFAKKNVSLQNVRLVPMTYNHDLINDTSIHGMLQLVLWGLYNTIIEEKHENHLSQEPFETIDSIFVHGGGPSATLSLGVLSVFLQSHQHIKNFKGASMGSILVTFVCIYPLHELYERFINAVTKHVFRNGLNKNEVAVPLNYQETLFFIRLFLGKDIARLTLRQFHETYLSPYNKTLDILVTNISTCDFEIFNHITKPNVLLEDALMCSCGVPFVIGIKEIEGKKYCDGDLFSFNYLQKNPNTYRILLTFENEIKTFDKKLFGSFCAEGAPLHCILETIDFYVKNYLIRLDKCGQHPLTFNVPIREYLQMLNGTALMGSRQYHILNYQYGVDWALEHLFSS